MAIEPVPVKVRYKRLETTASFCNVEIEAEVEHQFARLDYLGDPQACIREAIQECAKAVDAEIAAAKERKRCELWGRASDSLEDEDDLDECEDVNPEDDEEPTGDPEPR